MRILRDLSIRTKVLIPPAIFVLALVVVVLLGMYGMNRQRVALGVVNEIALTKVKAAHEFVTLSEQVQSDVYKISVLHSMNLPGKEIQPVNARLERGVSDLSVAYGEMLTRWQLDPSERAILERLKPSLATFRLQAQQAAAAVVDNPAFGVLLVRSTGVSFAALRTTLVELQDYQKAKIVRLASETEQTTRSISRAIVVFAFLIILGTIVVTMQIGTSLISRPIRFLTDLMHRLAAGDLAVDARGLEQRDEIGAMARAVEVFRRNALEKEQLDRRLRESEEKFSKAFMTSPYAITITGAEDGRFVEVNDAFTSITGLTREEAMADTSIGLKLWVSDEDRRCVLGELRAGQTVARREYSFRTKSDVIITGLFSAKTITLDGRTCILSSIDDVTEQRRLVGEKARLEDQLRQAQKYEAIGRLAGGVAHDFNNITAIVLGYAEILLGRLGLEDPSRKYLEQIVAAGRRSAALTHQLLAFGRRQTLQPEVLDLNALLRNLGTMLARLIGADIQLEFKLAARLGCVTADPGQLEQVILNLVANARDAMPKGGKLTVETADIELDQLFTQCHESVVPGEYVLLAVTDTGCGMDQAAMASIFEPFYTTKERGKGTGLGLATTYGIVKQTGGYIWAASEPGVGTTFKIYLPRTDAQPQEKAAAAAGEAPRGNGELILLVEDEAPLRELVETVLSRLGYRVSAAASGPDALRLVQEQRLAPALVLTDVIMPGMSGAALAKQLMAAQSDLKVLYMSGYTDDAISSHGVLDPGTHFIQKPFVERALAAKIREVLGKQSAGKESGAPKAHSDRPGRRVLMIDDDEQYRELVQHFCTKRGHVFAGADSAATALAALAGRAFDVLLVDLNIPGTSGERVLREIRAAGYPTPAIILTGDVASADMDVLRPLGAASALEKSSDAKPLLQAIESAT